MNDPVEKLFDPNAGAFTPEEETALCKTLARLQREADEDESSPRLRKIVNRVNEITKIPSRNF
jgi:hypothetical protein